MKLQRNYFSKYHSSSNTFVAVFVNVVCTCHGLGVVLHLRNENNFPAGSKKLFDIFISLSMTCLRAFYQVFEILNSRRYI